MPKYFLGDSHSGWYRRAAVRAGRDELLGGPLVSAIQLQGDFFEEAPDGGLVFKGRAAENAVQYLATNRLGDLREAKHALIVSLGLHAAPFYGGRDFRHAFSLSPEMRPERRPLSRSTIRTMVADLQRPALAFYDYLVRHDLLFAVVEPPPPQARHPSVEGLGADKVLELTALWQAPVRARLAEIGCPLLAPENCADDHGFLQQRYWAEDVSHANLDYGDLVIASIDARMAR